MPDLEFEFTPTVSPSNSQFPGTAAPLEATRISPSRALELLHELRQQLLNGVATNYAEHLGAARRDLRQLADRAVEAELRDLYETAHAFITNSGLSLLADFQRVFNADFDNALGTLTGQGQDPWEVGSELCLVDADDFERDLAVGKLAAKATYACSQQLTALDRRLAALLGLKRLDSEANPLTPRRLFQAFLTASSGSWAGEQLSLVLLETFEHYSGRTLPGLYQQMNQCLIDAGVLPQLPMVAEDGTELLPGRTSAGGDTGAGVSDVFVQLASGLSQSRYAGSGGGAGGMGGFAGSFAGGGDGAPAATPNAQFAPLVLGQFITGLTSLQRGATQAAATLGIDTAQVDPNSSALLHSLGQSPLLRWLQPNEAVTVDMVAMLFDCIFSDPEVPDTLRSELGRLQVPVLKVALLNRAFFTDQRHPARRLMDLIAQAARGWGPREHEALLKAIRSITDNINNGFEQDTGVFAAQVARLEDILQGADKRARERVSPLVRRLEQRDRKQLADATVKTQLERRLAGATLPTVVERFIQDTWREVLRVAYIEEGESGEAWRAGLKTLEQLVWSVQPKTSPQERQELMGVLPKLLEALPAGMARIGRGEAWDGFLIALMDLHMAAIRADASVAADSETGPNVAAVDGPSVLLSVAEPEDHPADLAGISPPSEDSAAATGEPADAEAAAAARIAVGDWVTFRMPNAPEISLRACWISRYGGLLLFSDRPGEHARVLTRTQLAREMREGTATALSNAALTDRAVAALLVRAAPKADGTAVPPAAGPARSPATVPDAALAPTIEDPMARPAPQATLAPDAPAAPATAAPMDEPYEAPVATGVGGIPW